MTGDHLLHELEGAASRVRLAHLEKLKALGVSYSALGNLGAQQHTIGIERISKLPNGTYEPSDSGSPACLVAAVDPDRALGDAGIYDLIAFTSDYPARWWWRCGNANALGAELLFGPDPVPVVATPLDWLSRAGEALCILDWGESSPVWSLLRHGAPLTFSDEGLRQRVRNTLIQSAPMPKMEISYAA